MTIPFSRAIATCAAVLLAGAAVLLFATAPAESATQPARAGDAASVRVSRGAPPFARVYLATRGCTSCSHCRTNIRQMLRPKTKGADTRFGDDQIEVTYTTPQAVPLREVIRSLADSRLHDLNLVDVLFEADGVIRTARDGALTFEIAGTRQPFPLRIERSTARPADGTPVRLTSRVEGWRGKGALSLHAREIRAAI